jgi:hypothetical protein
MANSENETTFYNSLKCTDITSERERDFWLIAITWNVAMKEFYTIFTYLASIFKKKTSSSWRILNINLLSTHIRNYFPSRKLDNEKKESIIIIHISLSQCLKLFFIFFIFSLGAFHEDLCECDSYTFSYEFITA